MPDHTTVSLHEYLIRLLEEHEKRQDTELAAMDKALILARAEADKQYHALNNLRNEYNERSNLFLTTSVYDAKHDSIVTRMDTMDRKLSEVRDLFRVWGSVILALSIAFQLAAHIFIR
jgi:hypothetical protein